MGTNVVKDLLLKHDHPSLISYDFLLAMIIHFLLFSAFTFRIEPLKIARQPQIAFLGAILETLDAVQTKNARIRPTPAPLILSPQVAQKIKKNATILDKPNFYPRSGSPTKRFLKIPQPQEKSTPRDSSPQTAPLKPHQPLRLHQ